MLCPLRPRGLPCDHSDHVSGLFTSTPGTINLSRRPIRRVQVLKGSFWNRKVVRNVGTNLTTNLGTLYCDPKFRTSSIKVVNTAVLNQFLRRTAVRANFGAFQWAVSPYDEVLSQSSASLNKLEKNQQYEAS